MEDSIWSLLRDPHVSSRWSLVGSGGKLCPASCKLARILGPDKHVPQSPRWLLTRDRDEEALKSLRLLRKGAFTEEEIIAEFKSIQKAISTTIKKGSFMDMFRGST